MTEQNPNLKFLRQKAMNLPLNSGVYIMKDKDNNIIYIGKAKMLKNRVSQYFGSDNKHSLKVIQMVLNVIDFDYIVTDTEFEALVLENSLIKKHQPKYNILLKDDKGYSYIRISRGDWPNFFAVKQKLNDNCIYIGPYMSSVSVKNCVDEAKKIFKIPTCSKKFPQEFRSSRPCLNFYINQCDAPCGGKIKQKDYYQNFSDAIDFIKNGSSQSIEVLTEKMFQASEELNFERAAKLRDKINSINRINEKQKIVSKNQTSHDIIACVSSKKTSVITILKYRDGSLSDRLDFKFHNEEWTGELIEEFLERYYQENDIPKIITLEEAPENKELLEKWLSDNLGSKVEFNIPLKGDNLKLLEMCKKNAAEKLSETSHMSGKELSAVEELAKLLGMKKLPEYIEAYDISNLSGGETVGAMVVFKDGRPLKAHYRRFKIQTVEGQDDYSSMKEMLTRRFTELKSSQTDEAFKTLPSVILLDGGKGHVSTIEPLLKTFELEIPIFGMVKDHKHKTRAITATGSEISINSTRRAFTLVSNIQEEVHRFAISYHRTLRKKSTISPILLEIDLIGETRAKALYKKFKTISAISTATLAELEETEKMTKESALSVYKFFKNDK